MTPETKDQSEFFVGYQTTIGEKTAAFLLNTIIIIGCGLVITAICLSYNQKKFSSANFEYGVFTTVEGVIVMNPIPHVRVLSESDTNQTFNQAILLVGFGKAGAENTIRKYEASIGSLENKKVKLSGQLIHGNNKVLMQIDENNLPLISGKITKPLESKIISSTNQSIIGEIVDPKCFFGVMKPGEGKIHRSCAIRCISGGIPPILHTSIDDFILLDENEKPINDRIQDIVGDKINLEGSTYKLGNWKVLLLNKKSYSGLKVQQTIASMEKEMTICMYKK